MTGSFDIGKNYGDKKNHRNRKEDHQMDEWSNELLGDSGLSPERSENGSQGATVTKLPSRVVHAVRGGVGTVADTVSNTAETIVGTVGQQSTAAARKVSSGGRVAVRQAQKNALYVTLGSFAVGFVLGMFVPGWLGRRSRDMKA
jgi:hypothetical protein